VRTRTLGRTGLEVSELGFGTWGVGNAGWIGAQEAESIRALRTAFSLGVSFVDTALAYGSEEIVGRAVRAAPETVAVATKIPTKNGRWPARAETHPDEMYPADWVVRCTEESLRNLGVETIDLQQLHTWADPWVDDGEWMEGFERLKRDGKIRFAGVSLNNHEAASGLRLVTSGVVDAVQVIYNVFDQSPDDGLHAAAARSGVGVIARSPFDEGALAGVVTPTSVFPEGDFRNEYFGGMRRQDVWDRVEALTLDLGISVADLPELALRFCITAPAVSTVIAGMRSTGNVLRNVDAARQGALDAQVVEALRRHRWERDYFSGFYTD
jgi:aryl-alcohol dehydrogenase-like predicted oxidoreductase